MRRKFHMIAPLAAALQLCSCSTLRFYSQAIGGQSEILGKARPIATVLADRKTSLTLRQRLTVVQDLRQFARTELHLPAKGQYDRYTDLRRPYVVWVVFATPEFSMKSHEWWYPIIGKLKYRGYFSEKLAHPEAAKLAEQGLDVFVHGVEAYSTLGFFHDPVLNTFVHRGDAHLAELLFHELTHQRLYLHGDTDFNEAFATAVGQEGARRWLMARGRFKDLRDYDRRIRIQREFIHELMLTRSELKALYAKADSRTVEQLRKDKTAAFARLRRRLEAMNHRYGGILKIDDWFALPVNNARLNSISTYHTLVPGFEAMLKSAGGDLEVFLKQVDAMRHLSEKERRRRLLPADAAEILDDV